MLYHSKPHLVIVIILFSLFILNVLNSCVKDKEIPFISCPEELITTCDIAEIKIYESYDEFVAAGGFISDNEKIDKRSFKHNYDISDKRRCPEIISRGYQISDVNGNTNFCEQTIILTQDTDPCFLCPPSKNIIIGDSLNSSMIYKKYNNKHLCNSSTAENVKIDVNDDGIDDINFHIKGGFSKGSGSRWVADCSSLNDSVQLCYEEFIDSVYLLIDTNKISSSPVKYRITESYSCNPTDERFEFYSKTNSLYPSKFKQSDTLSLNREFTTSILKISNNRGYDHYSEKVVNDTIYNYSYFWGVTYCQTLPFRGDCYIGFKFTQNGIDYLGWILLEFKYPDVYCIYIKESAIQK